MPKPLKGHHGHVWCPDDPRDGFCVPQFLHDQLEQMLGAHIDEFDLFAWYPKRARQRRRETHSVEEPLTWWREALRTELRWRGWTQPRKRPQDEAKIAANSVLGSWNCPHSPRCERTRQCIERTVLEMRKGKDPIATTTREWSPHNSE